MEKTIFQRLVDNKITYGLLDVLVDQPDKFNESDLYPKIRSNKQLSKLLMPVYPHVDLVRSLESQGYPIKPNSHTRLESTLSLLVLQGILERTEDGYRIKSKEDLKHKLKEYEDSERNKPKERILDKRNKRLRLIKVP
jgi:hypothetical protein